MAKYVQEGFIKISKENDLIKNWNLSKVSAQSNGVLIYLSATRSPVLMILSKPALRMEQFSYQGSKFWQKSRESILYTISYQVFVMILNPGFITKEKCTVEKRRVKKAICWSAFSWGKLQFILLLRNHFSYNCVKMKLALRRRLVNWWKKPEKGTIMLIITNKKAEDLFLK